MSECARVCVCVCVCVCMCARVCVCMDEGLKMFGLRDVVVKSKTTSSLRGQGEWSGRTSNHQCSSSVGAAHVAS